tara:strand:+ start:26030 stop:26356 length:327 start_codon:yes stop_codon:yes gene_type:complete
MSACEKIELALKKSLAPSHLEVINESFMHNVEPGAESHVRVIAVSEVFEGLNLVKRHQAIYKLIGEELSGPIHAITLHTFTATEWKDRNESAHPSPDCEGGSSNKPKD